MPRASDGTCSRTNGVFSGSATWTDQANSGDKTINAGRHDTHDNDLNDMLTESLARNGKGGLTADIDANNQNFNNLANATTRSQAVNAGQVQDSGVTYAVDTGAADAYAVTLTPAVTALVEGLRVHFRATNTNTGASTLKVNGTANTAIVYQGTGSALQAGSIQTGATYTVIFDGTSFRLMGVEAPDVVPLPTNFITGLECQNNSTDADHDIDILTGKARDQNDTKNVILSSVFTKQLDAAWAQGSGNGGLFSGTIAADTWYYIWLIDQDSDGAVDAGFDTSSAGSNTPAGWTARRLLWAILTDSSANILVFFNVQGVNHWGEEQQNLSTSTPSTTWANLTVTAPPGLDVNVTIETAWDTDGSGGGDNVFVHYVGSGQVEASSLGLGKCTHALRNNGTNLVGQQRMNCVRFAKGGIVRYRVRDDGSKLDTFAVETTDWSWDRGLTGT